MDELFLHIIGNLPSAVVGIGLFIIANKNLNQLKNLLLRYGEKVEECCNK